MRDRQALTLENFHRIVPGQWTRQDVERFILEGERSTWQRMSMVRNQVLIGQALDRCIERLERLHLPAERHIRNVREQGNIGAAGCPSAVAQRLDKLHKGDQIVYAVLGAGLAWGGGYMEVQ